MYIFEYNIKLLIPITIFLAYSTSSFLLTSSTGGVRDYTTSTTLN